jgi:hypothetical protein
LSDETSAVMKSKKRAHHGHQQQNARSGQNIMQTAAARFCPLVCHVPTD